MLADMAVSNNLGGPFFGKDHNVFGSSLGTPYCQDLPDMSYGVTQLQP